MENGRLSRWLRSKKRRAFPSPFTTTINTSSSLQSWSCARPTLQSTLHGSNSTSALPAISFIYLDSIFKAKPKLQILD